MIINTVTLHNFMSYEDAKLDLTPVRISCLSGLNGAGKSAILDAVTWALWEAGRAPSEDLIRMGQTEMWVDLCFELEEQIYRVRRGRQRSSPKAGSKMVSKGSLELQIWTGNKDSFDPLKSTNGHNPGAWKSLTAPSMRETQARITALMRMDYDTFVNSVYLRQGRADEFTTRLPSERKQVLADILGLSYFDKLQELSKEEAKSIRGRIEQLESALTGTTSLQENLDEIEASLAALQSELDCQNQAIRELESAAAEIQSQRQQAQLAETRLESLQSRLTELRSSKIEFASRKDELEKTIQSLLQLVVRSQEIEEKAAKFESVKNRVEHLDGISLEVQELTNQRLELRGKVAGMRGRLEVELEHQRQQLDELSRKKNDLEKSVKDSSKLEKQHHEYKKLLLQEQELSAKQESFVRLGARVEELQSLVTETRVHLEAQIEQREAGLKELLELMSSRASVDKEQQDLKLESETLDKLEVEFDLVEEKGLRIKAEIEEQQALIRELRRRQEENVAKAKELETAGTSSSCPLCAAPIVDRAAVLKRYHDHNGDIDKEIAELENKIALLEDKRQDLRKDYILLRQRLERRKELDMRIGEFNAKLAALDRAEENYARIKTQLDEAKRKLEESDYAIVERESLINIKAELHNLEYDPAVYSNLQAQIRAQRHVEMRYQQLLRDRSELEALDKQLPEVSAQVTKLSAMLQDDSFAEDERQKIAALEQELSKYSYDRHEHQVLRQDLASLLPYAEQLRDLQRAQNELPATQALLHDMERKQNDKDREAAETELEIGLLLSRKELLPLLMQKQTELGDELQKCRMARDGLLEQAATAKARRDQLQSDISKFEEKKEELKQARQELDDYTLLSDVLGKKGIQAIIIENAVPEIEVEANRLLSQLTDNKMHIGLLTQQKTKQGNSFETLDIVIADDVGTRKYELYSGGEAFKINFAIRVALSRLLARRAGAKLQSLIIDEGFGSQDELSRGRLISAINSIRGDFARILIVTHISEIKDLFPMHIQVHKENGVSNVSLVC